MVAHPGPGPGPGPGPENAVLAILAGGEGKRLGGIKKPLLRTPDGKTLLDALIDRLRPSFHRILIVAPEDPALDREGTERIFDPRRGPGVALKAVADACDQDAWIFLVGGDQAGMTSALLDLLWAEHEGVQAVVGTVDGRREPLGALYLASAVRALKLEGSPGLQIILGSIRVKDVALDERAAALVRGVNTPEEAKALGLAP